ncbi:MAG: TetR/AcrR family transcriptional regulator [Ruminococcus sp.]|nr:TetR/AcrR family transcriptional regulator [Ruminococcus sp.]
MDSKKTDLRIIRTRKAIRDAFNELITEMDYEDITIKELTTRAMINRNTFYLHYDSIDALMQELQDETVEHFIGKEVSYSNMDDLKAMIRVFFERAAQQSPVQEKILTSGSYRFVYDSINKRIMDHRRRTNKGAFGLDEASESIVFAYYGDITAILYRQWVTDGKKLTLDEIIELATKLICEGMGSVVK